MYSVFIYSSFHRKRECWVCRAKWLVFPPCGQRYTHGAEVGIVPSCGAFEPALYFNMRGANYKYYLISLSLVGAGLDYWFFGIGVHLFGAILFKVHLYCTLCD